jgi:adenylylsulfate kinase-like enzyme
MAKLLCDQDFDVIVACVSPGQLDRTNADIAIGLEHDFYLIWIDTPLEVCEKRDIKGMYARARAGEILKFTGVSAAYQEPKVSIRVETVGRTVEHCVLQILDEVCK